MEREKNRIKRLIEREIKICKRHRDKVKELEDEESIKRYEIKINCLEELLVEIDLLPTNNPIIELLMQNHDKYDVDLTLNFDEFITIKKDDFVSYDGEWIIIHEKLDSDEKIIPPILKVFNVNNVILAESARYEYYV